MLEGNQYLNIMILLQLQNQSYSNFKNNAGKKQKKTFY